MAKTIDRRIKLTRPQSRIFKDPARFIVVVAGRRFGKSFLSRAIVGRKAVQKVGSLSWYVGPTYRQAKDISWRDFKTLFPREMLTRDPHEGTMALNLWNESQIELRGAQDPDKLRGPGIDGQLVLDEFATMKPEAWYEVLRPMLSDKGKLGSAMFIGTPQGYNHFYDLYIEAQSGKNAGWSAYHFTTLEGENVDPDEVEHAKRDLDPRSFRQEYEASFENIAGRVYYAFTREMNIDAQVQWPPMGIQTSSPENLPEILIGMDFNVDPMTAVCSYRAADQCHIFDEFVIPDANTTLMMQAIRARYPMPQRILVYPDPSGNSRKTSAGLGVTDHTIIRSFNCTVISPYGSYSVADRLNTTNGLFHNAADEYRCFISPSCVNLLKAVDGLTYKQGTGIPDPSSPHIHITDAMGYMIMGAFPMHRTTVTTQEFLV